MKMCNTNGARDCKELLKISQQDRFPKLKDFTLKMHWTFGNTYVCESTFSTMKQFKSKKKSNGRRSTGG